MKNERATACIITRPIDQRYPDLKKMVARDAIVLPMYNVDINKFFLSKSVFK
jgi:hypothetical protein